MRPDFTLVPIGGLGNRISVITSAINYSRDYNLSLEIIWFKDRWLNCGFYDLFSSKGIPKETVTIKEAQFSDYILKDRPRKKNFYIPYIYQKINYQRRFYEKEMYSRKDFSSYVQKMNAHTSIYMIECALFYTACNCGKYFQLNEELSYIVNEIVDKFGNNKTLGVHIRRSDSIDSIEYSPTDLFIKKMEQEIEKTPDIKFYLASDSVTEKNNCRLFWR